MSKLQAFDVYRHTSSRLFDLIDTVYYSESVKITADEVRRSLVNHDGYPPDIIVRKQ